MTLPAADRAAHIRAQAPGKIVLWGEYAVLAGAPALVMAVDRHAACTIGPAARDWQFTAQGFSAPGSTITRTRLLDTVPPEPADCWLVAWHAVRALAADRLPSAGRVETDTRDLHRRGTKLGLGSSAAVAVATYAAFGALVGATPDYASALRIHAGIQGGRGSGLDVAAAFFGGLLRFEQPGSTDPDPAPPERWQLPADLHHGFVWTGHAASTVRHLERFAHWREHADDSPLTDLADSARALFARPPTLDRLRDYGRCLEALDGAARLGIFSASHCRLGELANASGVVYKPCGAGGGDLGVAFAEDPDALHTFLARARDNQFTPIALETAPHGIQVTR